MKTARVLHWTCYIIVPLALIVVSVIAPTKDTFNFFGNLALNLLMFLLLLRPVGYVFDIKWMQRWVGYRRQLGVAVFWLALFHSVMHIQHSSIYDLGIFAEAGHLLFFGAWAMLGMAILGVTSNQFSTRLLKRNWQRLHWLVYPTFVFAAIHAGMAGGHTNRAYVAIGLYAVLRIMAAKKIRLRTRT